MLNDYFFNKTCGLLGYFNGDCNDDWLGSDLVQYQYLAEVNEFAATYICDLHDTTIPNSDNNYTFLAESCKKSNTNAPTINTHHKPCWPTPKPTWPTPKPSWPTPSPIMKISNVTTNMPTTSTSIWTSTTNDNSVEPTAPPINCDCKGGNHLDLVLLIDNPKSILSQQECGIYKHGVANLFASIKGEFVIPSIYWFND